MTTNHELRAALDNARIAFNNLADVFEKTLAELDSKTMECDALNAVIAQLTGINNTLHLDFTQMRDRLWQVESERDTALADMRAAITARDGAQITTNAANTRVSILMDEIKKLRDVILNVAVAIDNEVKIDPRPETNHAEAAAHRVYEQDRVEKTEGRPIPSASLSEVLARETAEVDEVHGDGFRPAYA